VLWLFKTYWVQLLLHYAHAECFYSFRGGEARTHPWLCKGIDDSKQEGRTKRAKTGGCALYLEFVRSQHGNQLCPLCLFELWHFPVRVHWGTSWCGSSSTAKQQIYCFKLYKLPPCIYTTAGSRLRNLPQPNIAHTLAASEPGQSAFLRLRQQSNSCQKILNSILFHSWQIWLFLQWAWECPNLHQLPTHFNLSAIQTKALCASSFPHPKTRLLPACTLACTHIQLYAGLPLLL